MAILDEMMAPGARQILTCPVGKDAVCAPLHRIYDEQRLPRLLDGYDVPEDLVLDGGSTDGSADIHERFDELITWWTSEPDDGQTPAINRGIGMATGDVVAYINSDDYFLPGAFATAMDLFEKTNARW